VRAARRRASPQCVSVVRRHEPYFLRNRVTFSASAFSSFSVYSRRTRRPFVGSAESTWVAPEVVLAMRWAWVGQVADRPITERPNENAPQGLGGQPRRPRGPIALRGPAENSSIGLTLLLLPEGLGVESCVGRASNPGQNRQGEQGGYDRLHGSYSRSDPDNTIVAVVACTGLGREPTPACSAGQS
jgi:hypothetical protein